MSAQQADTQVSDTGTASAASGEPDRERPRRELPGWLMVAIPVLAELVVGGYRIAGPSFWRDEGYTIVGSQRPVGAIWSLVQNQDAVHGPYYLLMHFVIAAGGISETTLRLPSLIAMCLAAGLTAVLARRLAAAAGLRAPSATGLAAGLLLTAVPLTTRYAQEARTYGLTMSFAVLATYLLIRAASSRRWGWWAGYALAIALVGMFSILAVLLAAAHGISLMAAKRISPRRVRSVPGAGGVSAGDPDLRGLSGAGTDRGGADSGHAYLDHADVVGMDRVAADRGGVDGGRGGLGGADAGGADRDGQEPGADFGRADACLAQHDGADLGHADLGGASAGGADLGRADLGHADLGGASVGGADLGRADLGRAGVGGTDRAGADLGRKDVAAGLGSDPSSANGDRARASSVSGTRPGGLDGALAGGTVMRWLAACGAAAALLAPMIFFTVAQSSQVNWITTPNPSTVATLVRDFAGGVLLIPVIGLLAIIGCFAGRGLRRGIGLTLAVVTLPWLVLPPVLLLAVSLVHPVYVERYVVFCLPPLSVLTAAGLTWLVELTRTVLRGRGVPGGRAAKTFAFAPSAVLAVIVVAALIGPQLAIRRTTARVDDLRAVAATVAANERLGDAIVYLPWDTRPVGMAYPAPFLKLRDVELGTSPTASATLRGVEAPASVVVARLRGVRRVWTVQWAQQPSPGGATPADVATAAAIRGMRLIERWHIASVVLSLYAAR